MKTFVSDSPEYERLLPFVKGNVGFVFTNDDLKDIRDIILTNKVAAPARAGALAPADVWVPAGNTGMEPTKTSFFQALSIPTKITKGTVEIINDVALLQPGDKVGSSEAALLQMMGINPFFYGMGVQWVYDDGAFFKAAALDLSDEAIEAKFLNGVSNVAAVSLQTGIPTEASIPHSVVNAFKNLLSIAVATDFEFEQAKEIKAYLADPSKFAVAAAPVAAAAAVAAPAKEESEEEEEDMGMDLFG